MTVSRHYVLAAGGTGGHLTPAFALLACLTADLSLGFARKLKDQQAADRAINYATMAGMNATASQIQSEAASGAGLPTSAVKVTFWLECDGVVQSSYSGYCASGIPARYVSVAITDSYTLVFGKLLSASAIALRGYAEVRLQ